MDASKILKELSQKITNEINQTVSKEIHNAVNELENKLKVEINNAIIKLSASMSGVLNEFMGETAELTLSSNDDLLFTKNQELPSNFFEQEREEGPTTLDYLGGDKNEELRVLLKYYAEQLKDGEGILIIYRIDKEENPYLVFGRELKSIIGPDWNYIHEQTDGDSYIKKLVTILSKRVNEGLSSVKFLFLSEQAGEEYHQPQLCFCVLGKKDTEITHLKGIIHQQTPMGMNIHSLCESNSIIQALIETEILRLLGKNRHILAKNLCPERVLNTDFRIDETMLTHAVIEMNIFIDPNSIVNYLLSHIKKHAEQYMGRAEEYDKFLRSMDEIKRKLKDDTYAFGIDMVHDLSKLVMLTVNFCGEYGKKLINNFDSNEWNYIGEISFTSIISGSVIIHRLKTNSGELFFGATGYNLLKKKLQAFFYEMSNVSYSTYSKKIEQLNSEKVKIGQHIVLIIKQMYSLVKDTLTEESRNQIIGIEKEINSTYSTIEKATDILLNLRIENDFIMVPELENAINTLKEKILPNRRKQRDIVGEILPKLPGITKLKYEVLRTKVIDMEKSIQVLEDIILSLRKHYMTLDEANNKLRRSIQWGSTLFQIMNPDGEYNIAACSSFPLTDDDKEVFSKYGAECTDVPNRLFVPMPGHSAPNRMFINDNYFYRIASTPFILEIDIYEFLNKWADEYTMTVQDYVDAYFWVNENQSIINFPESGRWTVAETLYHKNEKCRLLFCNFGSQNEIKILNPFWKDIGLYLLKDIADGQAFVGEEFEKLNFEHPPLKNIKINLQNSACEIISNTSREFIESKVTKLFTDYLNVMSPLHAPFPQGKTPRFKIYSRNTSDFKKGYLEGGILSWNKYIYQSANAPFPDDESSKFFLEMREKRINSGQHLLGLSPNLEAGYYEPSNALLREMQKAESENKPHHLYELGSVYLNIRKEYGQYVNSSDKDILNQIETLVKKYEIFVNPRQDTANDIQRDSVVEHLMDDNAATQTQTSVQPVYPELLKKYVNQEVALSDVEQVVAAIQQIQQDIGATAALEVLACYETWAESAK